MADKPESPLVFPKKADKARLERYLHYEKLYTGEHFDAFSIAAEKKFNDRYARLRYLTLNFAGLMSRVMADMLFGESPTVDVENQDLQEFIDGLWETNQLGTQLYESALVNSRSGDDVFKIRVGPRRPDDPDAVAELIIEQVNPTHYFPEFDRGNGRNQASRDVLVEQFEQADPSSGRTECFIHKEIHTPGLIVNEVYQYNPKEQKIVKALDAAQFGYEPEQETGAKRSLVFHIPNVRDGATFWGASDYRDMDSLFFAINNRLTKVDNILDKHSDPILAVPPGVLDESGNVNKEHLGMFEVDNENPGFNKPEYIVWNANLDSAMKEIDKLLELLFLASEIAPASLGADQKAGMAESGRALKFKLLATIRKRNRKLRYYDQAIKDMLVTAQDLSAVHKVAVNGLVATGESERPTLEWGSGMIEDRVEEIDNAIKRVDGGLSSRADEIARLDNITPDEARDKVKEIDKEDQGPLVPSPEGDTPPVPPPAGGK